MTREQFDARYAATQDTTEGFSDADLKRVNDAVFAEVSDMDQPPWNEGAVNDHVQNVMDRKMNSFIIRKRITLWAT